MARFDEVLLDLVKPMVEDKDSLEVRQMPSNNEKEIVLYVYAKNDEIPKVLNGLGIAIISTSKGIMTDKEARKQNIGGEVLAYIW